MNGRRGMVLLSVLWVVVLLGTLAAGMMLVARRGLLETRNRLTLSQARWALGWCENLAFERIARDSGYVGEDASLSNGTRCRLQVSPVNARLNLNTADSLALERFFQRDTLVAAVLDARDPDDIPRPHGCEEFCYRAQGLAGPVNRAFLRPAELRQVAGFRNIPDSILALLTLDGDGRINPAHAPAAVLASLPGVSLALARRVALEARQGRITSLASMATLASPIERQELDHWWTDLLARTTFERGPLILEAAASSALGPAVATERVLVDASTKEPVVTWREGW